MLIYFADRNFNILGSASTTLPDGLRIVEDKTIEDAISGVNTLELVITTDYDTKDVIRVGCFILKSSNDTYDTVYQIIETEFDSLSKRTTIYAEDAGLDLINRTASAVDLSDKTLTQMINYFAPSGWRIIVGCESGTKKSNSWDGESSLTERLHSVCNLFDAEMYFTFDIDAFTIKRKTINIVKHRGSETPTHQLRLNYHVNQIITKKSIADLATAYRVKGAIPDGGKKPINLKDYDYSYTDSKTGDVYKVDKSTGQMRNITAMKRWSSVLDTDGLIVREFNFDTTSKSRLAGLARASLQKYSNSVVSFDVDIAILPEDCSIGDRINIIDEHDELYLEGRLLQLEISECSKSIVATVGDFMYRASGISEQIRELLAQTLVEAESTVVMTINSDKGTTFGNNSPNCNLSVSISVGSSIIETADKLKEVFGDNVRLVWYRNDVVITDGVSDGGFRISVPTVSSLKTIYRCELTD